MEFGKQKRSIPDSIAIHGVTVVTSVSYSSGAGLEKNRSRGVFKQQLSLVPHCPWGRGAGRGWIPAPAPSSAWCLEDSPTSCRRARGLCAPSACSWQGLQSAAGSAECSRVCGEQHGSVAYGANLQPALELLLGVAVGIPFYILLLLGYRSWLQCYLQHLLHGSSLLNHFAGSRVLCPFPGWLRVGVGVWGEEEGTVLLPLVCLLLGSSLWGSGAVRVSLC